MVRREAVEPVRTNEASALAVLHGVPELPLHFLPRRTAFAALKGALLGIDQPTFGVSAARGTGLHGLGGIGKTVLAVAVARDPEARRAFADGIHWLTLGQQPSVVGLQQALLEALGGERTALENTTVGTRYLRAAMENKNCLLVVDDAWELEHVQPFDVLGPKGRLLVTTRDSQLLTALGARTQDLDVLDREDAEQLLATWAGATVPLPAEAADVARRCGHLPLALALAGAQVRDGASWRDVGDALATGDLEFLDHPYGSVFKSLAASVRALPEAEALRYRELAIFPEDTPVPEDVIARLWSRSGVGAAGARKLLRKFASRALLTLIGEGEQKLVTFHDLQRDYLQLVAEDLAGMHTRLLGSYEKALPAPESGPARWASSPASESYLRQFLVHHLLGADQAPAARALLFDCSWLAAKLGVTDIGAVISDFAPLSPNREDPLGLLRDALVLASHVLAPRPEELAPQLVGRLGGEEAPELRAVVEAAGNHARRPALLPIWPRLTPPGGPLLRNFEGDLDLVNAVAIIPDGKTCLSGSHDNTLELWDLGTGQLLRNFEGHRGSVNAAAISPDGRTCLSGSHDNTLKLWNLASGTQLASFTGDGGFRCVAVTRGAPRVVAGDFTGRVHLLEIRL